MEEIIRQISGYEGLYSITSYGRVISEKRNRMLSPGKNQGGYQFVILWKNGRVKHCLVHRLVAETFIPNPDDLPEVNHIDEDKSNNRADNLEWCTSQYNRNYGSRNERSGSKRRNNTNQSKQIEQYTKDNVFIQVWPSGKEIERQLGYKQCFISRCCNGYVKSAYGYIWRFKEE